MNKIQLLDNATINKIAAGEVIERPYSVVKELVENSIDANAKEIIIKLKEGGKKQISVIDNGEGMSKEDLLLCTKKHATSKIKNIDDIFKIYSYGFRGEALATIAEVSKTEIISATKEDEFCNKIILEDGKIKNILQVTKRQGTEINIYNLFYTVPARQKFLKSEGYELKRIMDWIKSIAISNPEISFKVYAESDLILNLISKQNYDYRIKEIYNLELLKSDYSDPVVSAIVYFSKPNEVKDLTIAKQQYYINNRPIKNDTISKAIYKAFESKIPRGKKPHCFVFLTIDPQIIDINVHPQKLEIRTKNENMFYFPVYNAIRTKLEQGLDTNLNLELQSKLNTKIISSLSEKYDVIEKITEERKVRPKKEENKNFYQTQLQSRASNFAFANVIEQPTQLQKKYKIIGQLLDTYILIETNTKSLLIVDQHVAEERYYYEKFYDEYMQNKRINSQSLLVPITFEFSPDEVQLIKENSNELKQFGLDIDIFGKDSILLRQIPLQINNLPSKEDLRQMILDLIMENNAGQTFEQKKDHIIATMACKTSIKAETPLTEHKMSQIIEKLFSTKNPYTCPHGRPIIIELTKSEIEKKDWADVTFEIC